MPTWPHAVQIIPLTGMPQVRAGDDLVELLAGALKRNRVCLEAADVVVVAQKIVSKAEGAVVVLAEVEPGPEAARVAEAVGKDPAIVEVILSQSRRIVRQAPGVLITETHHGFVCANAGVDTSNSPAPGTVVLLPADPDGVAGHLRTGLTGLQGVAPGVVISDTFNRPWREGSINVAIGTAGIKPLHDARGEHDDAGKILRSTIVSIADELASAAQLVMGESGGVPAAVVRGVATEPSERGSGSLLRDAGRDLFR